MKIGCVAGKVQCGNLSCALRRLIELSNDAVGNERDVIDVLIKAHKVDVRPYVKSMRRKFENRLLFEVGQARSHDQAAQPR